MGLADSWRASARHFLAQDNTSSHKFELVPLLLPLITVLSAVAISPYLAVIYAFGLIPALDLWTGEDASSAPADKLTPKDASRFRSILKWYVPVHYAMLFGVIHLICHRPSSAPDVFALILSLGVGASMSFTVAHELLHSTSHVERVLSSALLLPNLYMHWSRAHIQHHAHVGTPKDPTTSQKGETVYAFWVRSIVGNIVNAYRAELKRRHGGNVAVWIAAPAALLLATYLVYGPLGTLVLCGQAVVSVLMLETVNYIEHYGLVRENRGAVLPKHSWNASTMYGNAVTFNLQRHSDHHASAQKPYYLLENIDSAPQLPAGYPAMMLLSLAPPLWFHVMDSRLETRTKAG